MPRLIPLLAPLALAACYPYTPPALSPANAPAPPAAGTIAAPVEARAPVTILVSIDGFRPDYLDRGITPRLSSLAAGGVSAPMRPSFPSKTFPNHWTLVTGLLPDHHGIVANTMTDVARPSDKFTMASDDPFWWNAAEPIWVTAERAGIRTASMFWPGSNVGWGGTRVEGSHDTVAGGMRPSDWQQFNEAITGTQRARAVVDWLRRPAAERPRFVALYFDSVDQAGHDHGPASPQMNGAVADIDRTIGELVDALAALGQPANLVIVSDHGMAATSSDRVIALDRIVPSADARVDEAGPYATFTPTPGHEAAVAAALARPTPHMQCWPKARIPAHFRFGTNPRIPPFLCLADTGWLLNRTAPREPFAGGNHGYDHRDPEMRALFIANGPAFAHGKRLPIFDNVDVAPLLRDLLGLPAAPLDGDDRPFRGVLIRNPR